MVTLIKTINYADTSHVYTIVLDMVGIIKVKAITGKESYMGSLWREKFIQTTIN